MCTDKKILSYSVLSDYSEIWLCLSSIMFYSGVCYGKRVQHKSLRQEQKKDFSGMQLYAEFDEYILKQIKSPQSHRLHFSPMLEKKIPSSNMMPKFILF